MSPEKIDAIVISKRTQEAAAVLELPPAVDIERIKLESGPDFAYGHVFVAENPLVGREVRQDGLVQQLYGVIQTANDYFSIVGVREANGDKQQYFLTHVNLPLGSKAAAPKADLIGQISQQPLDVGRAMKGQEKLSYTNSVSRNHFSISYEATSGKFMLQDNKSTFGTELWLPKEQPTDVAPEQKFALSSVRKVLQKDSESTAWSLPPEDLRGVNID